MKLYSKEKLTKEQIMEKMILAHVHKPDLNPNRELYGYRHELINDELVSTPIYQDQVDLRGDV